MKTLLALLLSALNAFGGVWTIHCTKDYSAIFSVDGPSGYWGSSWTVQWSATAYWDHWYDSAYPEYAYSGTSYHYSESDTWVTSIGYLDTQILTTPDTALNQVYFSVWDSGPEYAGGGEVYDLSGMYQPGEYWLDFASNGSMRITQIQPSDFGKWAWDGSINPSWVEPPLAPTKRGKGHKK